MLSATLRQLERDGLVLRHVYARVPARVEYELSDTGEALLMALSPLLDWGKSYQDEIAAARERFDRLQLWRAAGSGDAGAFATRASRASPASTSPPIPLREARRRGGRDSNDASRSTACAKPPAVSIVTKPYRALRSARTAWIGVVVLEATRQDRARAVDGLGGGCGVLGVDREAGPVTIGAKRPGCARAYAAGRSATARRASSRARPMAARRAAAAELARRPRARCPRSSASRPATWL